MDQWSRSFNRPVLQCQRYSPDCRNGGGQPANGDQSADHRASNHYPTKAVILATDAAAWILRNYDELQKGAALGDVYCGEVIRAYRARLHNLFNPNTDCVVVNGVLRLWQRTEFHVAD